MKKLAMKNVHAINYGGKWYLSIGRKAPWANPVQVRCPKAVALWIGGKK